VSKIVNGVANDLEFPQLDFVHHDSKTNEPLQKQIETFTRWQDPTIKEYKKEIERLNNIINEYEKIMKECSDRILKELNENNHLSYGPALSINYRLTNYKELKGGK